MNQPAIIAIDGPAASGKSSIGYAFANALNFLFFDTGIMYRAVTWAVLQQGIDPMNQGAVGELAELLEVDIMPPARAETDGRQATLLVAGQDVTWEIRTPQVDQNVSAVAANPLVRDELSVKQRQIAIYYGSGEAEKPGIVMVGRDIGTVIVPDAPIKIYMEATAAVRAQRRHAELVARGKWADLAQIEADIIRRDRKDSQREIAPMRPAADAQIVDTSDMSPEEVLEALLEITEAAGLLTKKSFKTSVN